MLARPTPEWLLVCSGTYEDAAYEDVLGAGAMVRRLESAMPGLQLLDSARLAALVHANAAPNLAHAMATHARNGRRLASNPELAADIAVCAAVDDIDVVARMDADGAIRRNGTG
jgi:phosphosulfolactate phosphohydrolase-like enzyme